MYPWLNELIAQPENLAFVSNNCLAFNNPMNFWQRVYNVLHTLYAKLYFNYLTKMQDDIVRKHFGPNLRSVQEMDVALMLINSHIVLNGIQPMTPAAVQIGGIHMQREVLPLSPVRELFLFMKPFHFLSWLNTNVFCVTLCNSAISCLFLCPFPLLL